MRSKTRVGSVPSGNCLTVQKVMERFSFTRLCKALYTKPLRMAFLQWAEEVWRRRGKDIKKEKFSTDKEVHWLFSILASVFFQASISIKWCNTLHLPTFQRSCFKWWENLVKIEEIYWSRNQECIYRWRWNSYGSLKWLSHFQSAIHLYYLFTFAIYSLLLSKRKFLILCPVIAFLKTRLSYRSTWTPIPCPWERRKSIGPQWRCPAQLA